MFPHEQSLVPIYRWTRGEKSPEQVGTGIYIKLGQHSYLFTAGHVTDHLEVADLCIPTKNGLHPGQRRMSDPIDIGYIRLSAECASETHPGFLPLSHEFVDPSALVEPGRVCSVAGYPISRAKNSRGVASSSTFSYVGVAAEYGTYERLGYNPSLHILIEYTMKSAIYPEGDKLVPPHPRGLSGGGIFRLSSSFPNDPTGMPRVLVAQMHTFLKAENLFLGTKLPLYFYALSLRYPEDVGSFTEA
jgi:hypothetical protein